MIYYVLSGTLNSTHSILCGIIIYFGSVFEKKTLIRFGVSLVQFGLKNYVWFGYGSYLLLV